MEINYKLFAERIAAAAKLYDKGRWMHDLFLQGKDNHLYMYTHNAELDFVTKIPLVSADDLLPLIAIDLKAIAAIVKASKGMPDTVSIYCGHGKFCMDTIKMPLQEIKDKDRPSFYMPAYYTDDDKIFMNELVPAIGLVLPAIPRSPRGIHSDYMMHMVIRKTADQFFLQGCDNHMYCRADLTRWQGAFPNNAILISRKSAELAGQVLPLLYRKDDLVPYKIDNGRLWIGNILSIPVAPDHMMKEYPDMLEVERKTDIDIVYNMDIDLKPLRKAIKTILSINKDARLRMYLDPDHGAIHIMDNADCEGYKETLAATFKQPANPALPYILFHAKPLLNLLTPIKDNTIHMQIAGKNRPCKILSYHATMMIMTAREN